ncbi:MAG TPA: alpha/beta hydrolase [Rhizomicrobium sp.]
MRMAFRLLFGVLLVAAVVAAAAFGSRAWRQHETAQALAIATPNGIDEASYIAIGHIQQWITIRGEDRANPVILILHGGPGGAISQLAPVFRGWEKDFTVVQWDQRGAGRTFGRNGVHEQPMTYDRMTRDGIEVAQYLLVHLHKKKLILLGHSWGTALGLGMVKAEPGLFFAYVGTGQVVAKEAKEEYLYARLMRRLKTARDADGIARLAALGPPPYKSEADLDVERGVARRFDPPSERDLLRNMAPVVLFAPGYTLRDIRDYFAGRDFAGASLYREILSFDARKLGTDVAVPFFIFDGAQDSVTPVALARPYFDSIRAPQKAFVVLPGAGHNALLTRPDAFLAELKRRVRPIAVQT